VMTRSSIELQAIVLFRLKKSKWKIIESTEGVRMICPRNLLDPRNAQATQWYGLLVSDEKIGVPEYAFQDDPAFSKDYMFIGGEMEGFAFPVLDINDKFQAHGTGVYVRHTVSENHRKTVTIFKDEKMNEREADFVYHMIMDRTHQ